MEKAINKQLADRHLLEELVDNFDDDKRDNRERGYYEEILKDMNELWHDLKTRHRQIVTTYYGSDGNKAEYIEKNTFKTIRELYQRSYGVVEREMQDKFPVVEVDSESNRTVNVSHEPKPSIVRLPEITLEKFDGDYTKWPSFHDLFQSLVDFNDNLAPVQKLQYLKLHLIGEPERLLRPFQVTDSNYAAAWSTLKKRYDNKRVLVDTQLQILLNQNNILQESAVGIRKLLDTTNECLQALTNMKIDVEGWDPILVYLTVQKLPSETHQIWEQGLGDNKNIPTWNELAKFLETRFRTLEAITTKKMHNSQERKNNTTNYQKPRSNSFNLLATSSITCAFCKESHHLRNCQKFLKLNIERRIETAKAKGICLNCLGIGHRFSNCQSRGRCKFCNKTHHTLLHRNYTNVTNQNLAESTQPNPLPNESNNTTSSENSQQDLVSQKPLSHNAATFAPSSSGTELQTYSISKINSNQILLATALVKIINPSSGKYQIARALIDPGSQTSFLSESMAQNIGLRKQEIQAEIHGIGRTSICHVKFQSKFTLQPIHNNDRYESIEAIGLLLPKLTHLIPEKTILHNNWPHLKGLKLADPEFTVPEKIDLLLGADIYSQIILEGIKKGPAGTPLAQRTIFGWVLSGEVHGDTKKSVYISNFHMCEDISKNLKAFWEIEEVPEKKLLTTEEEICENHFITTHKRLADGTYQVELPFKPEETNALGKSRGVAISRLLSMENRFKRDTILKADYHKCIQEYLDMKHMEPVIESNRESQQSEDTSRCSYLPHHAVIKESSTTTKLRIVFDASRPTSTGISLNDKMLKGPVVQDELAALLIKWRLNKIAFTADLEKMYRQISVAPKHADFQRIVWRNSSDSPIQNYRLKTVTFGTKSAPYLATRVLKQLAIDESSNFPLASRTTLNSFYVDDLLSGSHNIESALRLQTELINLMKSGGFTLRKWTSNAEEILNAVPEEHRELKLPLNLHLDETIRALGIQWNPATDKFLYTVNVHSTQPSTWTKRKILSEIAKLFDPLGWLAPAIIIAKMLMQCLWLSGTDWDDEVGADLKAQWERYRNELINIKYIQIERWLHYTKDSSFIEIHGFSDASMRAYAAAVYICIINNKGERQVSLVSAKTKVAPIKTISLPRLELSGAVLLAKLIKYLLQSLKFEQPIKIKAWTDSEIVLAWLKAHPSKWSTFVANRVSEIHDILGPNVWSHVPSKSNPADCASRGMYPSELRDFKMWWHGPEFLKQQETYWPPQKIINATELEVRKSTPCQVFSTVTENLNIFETLLNKHSGLQSLLRVIAYVLRFVHNTRNPDHIIRLSYITSKESTAAMYTCVQFIQTKHFGVELKSLKNRKPIPNNSRLNKLNPFLDTNNIIRLGGRLRNSNLSYNQKYPIILPDKNNFTKLLLESIHKETLHGSTQLMLNYLNRHFWLLNARNTIRLIIHKCINCYKLKATAQTQLMSDLPLPRVKQSRPFSHSGLDYCGPFELKTHKGRNPKKYKAYIALFICMAIKAVHLELVTDLTAEGFLAAYRRFSSRRGKCEQIYCDNGTNFVAASKQISKNHSLMLNQLNIDIASSFESQGVIFNFIPPGSPHFGGLWEAGVRSTKLHLKRIMCNTALTYEEFSTVITQIEACLNSRPLCEISSNPNDLNALTPAHFLIGDVLITPPDPSVLDIKIGRLDRWQYIQSLTQGFWRRWHSEYLNRLQQRPKWTKKVENVKINNIVLIKDENLPPTRWLLGRITEIHPGCDGLVRVVTVKTKNGLLKRSIAKICLLPLDTKNEEKSNREDQTKIQNDSEQGPQ